MAKATPLRPTFKAATIDNGFSSGHRRATERPPGAVLGGRKPGRLPLRAVPSHQVGPGQRHGRNPLGELRLEDHPIQPTITHLAQLEIEFPHAAEALVIERAYFFTIGLEPAMPLLERVGVVET